MSMNDMNRDNVREYVAAVGKYRPVFLKGYPSAVEIFLSLLKRGNIKLRTNFKAVFTNSEILYPTQRAFFEEFFGCKILDWYALQERVLAAAECGNKAGYHIFPEYGIIEFSDKKYFDNNEEGFEILATGLTNFGMPLIRYKTEDIGVPLGITCPCGRHGLPLMKPAGGRERDFFVTKTGNLISSVTIGIDLMTENIKQFQFVQKEKGKFILRLSKSDKFTQYDMNKLSRRLGDVLGDTVTVGVEFTDNFEKKSNGKFYKYMQLMKNVP